MSDPTIRLSTCRSHDCPECGRDVPYSGGLLPTLCGCRVCSSGCFSQHERRLLTEALRQRDAALGEAAHWKTSDEAWVAVAGRAMAILGNHHSSDLIGVAEKVAQERDAAIREKSDIAEDLRMALVEIDHLRDDLAAAITRGDADIRERDEARAHDAQPYPTAEAYERVCAALEATKRSLEQTRAAMEAGDLCTVCAGTGKPVSGKPCICDGHGGIGNQIIGLTREAFRERGRAEKAEALLRESLPHIYPHRHPTDGSDTLIARIREALPK